LTAPHWLPDETFDVSTLTRRQAAVFENLCAHARAGLRAGIAMLESIVNPEKAPFASDTVRSEHGAELASRRREAKLVADLQDRLTSIRLAPLTPAERNRLAEARQVKPDLSAAEAEGVIYGTVEVAGLRRAA
jgi:hypothetical protein